MNILLYFQVLIIVLSTSECKHDDLIPCVLQRKECQARERDLKYQAIMRNLVRRYVTQEQRKAENEGVTEDDVNEIKNDISAFRFEMIEIMRASGMNTQSASGPAGGATTVSSFFTFFSFFSLSSLYFFRPGR